MKKINEKDLKDLKKLRKPIKVKVSIYTDKKTRKTDWAGIIIWTIILGAIIWLLTKL